MIKIVNDLSISRWKRKAVGETERIFGSLQLIINGSAGGHYEKRVFYYV